MIDCLLSKQIRVLSTAGQTSFRAASETSSLLLAICKDYPSAMLRMPDYYRPVVDFDAVGLHLPD